MKSARNKTIDLPLEEGRAYLDRCISVQEPAEPDDVLDRVILGDSFSVLPNLPRACVDLAVLDPPYNLAKDYHGSAFSPMSNEDYTAYTERWIAAIMPLLKPDASIYVCCDWQSSPVGIMGCDGHMGPVDFRNETTETK